MLSRDGSDCWTEFLYYEAPAHYAFGSTPVWLAYGIAIIKYLVLELFWDIFSRGVLFGGSLANKPMVDS